MKLSARLTLCACIAASPYGWASDRFTTIVESAGDSTVSGGGFRVNQKRVAVQRELAQRPPTLAELGVKLPPKSALMLEQTARQIAQYHPVWRVYEYRLQMPRSEFTQYFQDQGLAFDVHANQLKFGNLGGEFIDGLSEDPITSFRVWRRP